MELTTASRKWMLYLIIFCLIVSGFSTVNRVAANAASTDVSGHWAEKQLLAWKEKGLLNGYADGTLRPDKPVTRGELMALTNRALGFTEEVAISFSDLRSTDWVYQDVARAVKAGYVQGNADGTIGAAKQISRQEAAVIMSRLLKQDVSSGDDTVAHFKDAKQIAPWAQAAVSAIVKAKVMVGDQKGTFRPQSTLTRAEAVVVLDRVISLLAEEKEQTLPPEPEKEAQPKPEQKPESKPEHSSSGPNIPSGPATQYGIITGHVRSSTNIDIEGATALLSGTTLSRKATTDATGAFRFDDVPAGSYKLIVSKDHYSDGISAVFSVTSGTTTVVDVTLEAGQSLSIVDNSEAAAVIVVDDTKLSAAAQKLASYVEKSSGAELPILTAAQLAGSGTQYDGMVRIYIGSSVPGAEDALAAKLQGLGDDGFVIMPYEGSIAIAGPTKLGTEFGVSTFLEHYVGVRWLMPGPDGEDVPEHDEITVSFVTIIDQPAAMSRHFFGTEAWYTLQTTADWADNNRMNNLIQFHHYLNVLFDPQVFSNHPEYYSGGVVPTHPYSWQPCFNDDTAAAAIWRIKDYFHNFPENKSFSLGINDSKNYCAADMARANGKLNSIGELDMSDVYYPWVNQVVEAVLEDYPDKYFGLLAYWNVYDPPTTVKLNSHVIPYITDDRMSWIDPDIGPIGEAISTQWQLKADSLGWYEYMYGTPYNLPRVYMEQMADNYKYAKEHGVVAHVAELFPNFGEGPKPWVAAKLQWDPDQDVNLLIDDWVERAVGTAAADDLKSYYALWDQFWTERVFQSDWYLNWKNSPNRTNFLNLLDHSYLKEVTKADLTQSRSLLTAVVAKAGTAKQKVRAEKLLRAFEYYEASALSYPRGTIAMPANETVARAILAEVKLSFDMAMKRQLLAEQFSGDPILNLTEWQKYSGKWSGVQDGYVAALESYAATITNPADPFLVELRQTLAYINSLNQITATAVKTTATKAQILAALDFSQGPWVDAVPITEFVNMTATAPAPGDTRTYLLWDDTNLYVGYENFDPDMSGIIVNDDAPGGWWRVADDSVETYVTGDVDGGFTGYFTNPKAVKFIYNSSPNGPVPGVNNQWEASAAMLADRWNVIQVIPFASIGIDPSQKKSLQGFFFRNYHGQSMFLGWAGGSPWSTSSFKTVHLVEDSNLIANPSFESGHLDAPWLATDWYSYLNAGSTVLRSSTHKRLGSFSLETSVSTPASSPFQVLPISPGKYKATINYFVPLGATASGTIQLEATLLKSGNTIGVERSIERPVAWMSGRWIQFEHIFDIAPDYNGEVPEELIFTIRHNGFNTGEVMYIDDVSLFEVTE